MSDRYRMAVGSLILCGLLALAVFVALGRVEEKTSYGLMPIMGIPWQSGAGLLGVGIPAQ